MKSLASLVYCCTSALYLLSALAAPIPHRRASLSVRADPGPKLVFAHFMVGNTFPYTPKDWADDIALARASGIDGFALNVGSEPFHRERVKDAYDAADAAGFKLFLSLDAAVTPCTTSEHAAGYRSFVTTFSSRSSQFQVEGKPFVSTFAGEACTFGTGSAAEGWKTQFSQHPELAGKIFLVPSFFVDPATQLGQFSDIMDGDFAWNSGWPIQLTPGASPEQISQAIGSFGLDEQHIGAIGGKPYMAAVSPWFFTHYGPGTFNKNHLGLPFPRRFLFLSDNHLYATRWEILIKNRDKVAFVEALTWNDFGESHYLGPLKGDKARSEAWTDGFDHTGWLALTKYYATAFKTGNFPTIEKNQLILWSRPHPTRAKSPDPIGPPKSFELTTDTVWGVALTTADSKVTISTSPGNTQSFDVPAGASKIAIKISAGETMSGFIEQGGVKVAEVNAEGFVFNGSPSTFNYNALVVSSK